MSGASNDWFGDLAEEQDELATAFDSYERLSDAGQDDVLDAFVAAKNISIAALVKQGVRKSAPTVLVWPYPQGLRYRDMESGQRWSAPGSEFNRCKIVRAGVKQTDAVIIAESETDGAWLSARYPDVDIALPGAGAKRFTEQMAVQLSTYSRVFVAYDADDAGEAGAAKVLAAVPHAARFAPPTGCKDWAEWAGDTWPLPDAPAAGAALLVSARELMDLDYPDVASWFENALLPIGGQMVEHGWAKSFKSYIALDILASLAQGEPWCGFEPTEEPCRVAVVQFEIPPKFYRDRVHAIRQGARYPDLFDDNFLTWTPQSRPLIKAGNKPQEDFMRATLVRAGVQVVLMDPVRRIMKAGLSMNDEDSVRYPLAFFESLQNEGITVIFTHHDNKGSAKGGGGDALDMTGSGAWAGDADSILSVALPKKERRENPRRNIHFLLRNGPSPSPRGFQLREDGAIEYSDEPYGPQEDDSEPAL